MSLGCFQFKMFNICAALNQSKNSQALHSDWGRLMESFSIGDCIQSPISSPPDIVCSSSGSSDTGIISRSHALHRVVTRLDFDSCVVQSSDACRQFRARVTRNVINLESRDTLLQPPEITLLESNEGRMPVDVSSVNPEVGVLEDDKGQMEMDVTSISPHIELKGHPVSCSDRKFSKKLDNFNVSNESEFCLLKSPDYIPGAGSDNDLTVSSPVIGRQKLSPRVRSFCRRNRQRKRRKKINDDVQQVVLCQEQTCPALGSHGNGGKDSYQLNQETETKVDLKNNMRLTAVGTDLSHIRDGNEISLVSSSQQSKTSQSNVVSPVMKCSHRWRKRKHSVKVSDSGKNCCDVMNTRDQSRLEVDDDVLKDECTEAIVSTVAQTLTPSSPVLGRSSEKGLRRTKIMMAAKSEGSIHDKELHDLSVVSSEKGVLLLGRSMDSTPQQNDVYSNFENDLPITLEGDRQTEDDKELKESQKCENYDVFGAGAKDASAMKEDVEVLKELKCSEEITGSVLCMSRYSIEADVTVETECSGVDIKKCIWPSSVEVGEAVTEDGYCGRKSVNVDSNILFPSNILCRADAVLLEGREQKCNAQVKEENPNGVMSSELLIETETSLDISMNKTSEQRYDVAQDKLSVISSPSSSAPSLEADLVISSCSTPKSDKVSAVTHHNHETHGEGGANLYLDSGKKKRGSRLNKSGLAARLQRLLSRVQSSTRMWQHEGNHANVLRSSKRGTILNVSSVWKEYSHLLVHCTSSCKFVPLHSSEDSDSSRSDVSMRIIVVLDPAVHIQIKPLSTIRLYPPWQRLCVPRLNVTLVLGVSCVEQVQSVEKNNWILSSVMKSQQQVTEMLYMCPCSCLQDLSGGKKCQFHFPRNGLEFLEYMLPQKVSVGALHSKATGGDYIRSTHCSVWQAMGMGTVAEVVVNQGCLVAEDICLKLFVLQVFRYKSRGGNKTSQNDAACNTVSWSILGCDAAGECCEVVLGPSPPSTQMSPIWTRIVTRQVIGHSYRLTEFTIMKRIHRTKGSGLWSVVTKCKEQFVKQDLNRNKEMKQSELSESFVVPGNLGDEHINEVQFVESAGVPVKKALKNGLCNSENSSHGRHDTNVVQHEAVELETSLMKGQLFVYVFSPGADSWEMEQLETVSCGLNISMPVARLSCLAQSLTESDGGLARHTYLAKLLYVTDNHVYLTDSSLGCVGLPGYMIMSIKPSCFVPPQIRDKKAVVVLLQDIEVDRGKLSADKYSWLTCVSNMDARRETSVWFPAISDHDLNLISSVQVILPNFTLTSTLNELVTITGTVAGVDEETAFSWPVCGICENELLVELGPNEYLCQKCDSSSQTSTKMSLEVFISCPQVTESCKVKVKLQQASIVSMLPTSQDNGQGYELSSVLGHAVGPLCCVVMKAGINSFLLNEIPMLE